ncbi:MAG: serine/threonine protein phosphatase, partial [Candidatus Competibacteraceae bacterium]|nr:serine/threonine protein phosphatase [Candidatus Competibacteraceae bacterium]
MNSIQYAKLKPIDKLKLAIDQVRKMDRKLRPLSSSKTPGGLVEFPRGDQREFIIIGDLHAAKRNLKHILLDSGNLGKLRRNELVIVFLGDLVHDDRTGYMTEMDTSIEVLDIVLHLFERYPNNIVYILGNHDTFSPNLSKLGIQQGLEFKRAVIERYGQKYAETLQTFFDSLPVFVMHEHFLATHAGPPRGGVTRDELINIDHFTNLKWQLIWNRLNETRSTPSMKEYGNEDLVDMRRLLECPEDLPVIVGHNPMWKWRRRFGLGESGRAPGTTSFSTAICRRSAPTCRSRVPRTTRSSTLISSSRFGGSSWTTIPEAIAGGWIVERFDYSKVAAFVRDPEIISTLELETPVETLLTSYTEDDFLQIDSAMRVPFFAEIRNYSGARERANPGAKWIIKKIDETGQRQTEMAMICYLVDHMVKALSAPSIITKIGDQFYKATKVIPRSEQLSGANYTEIVQLKEQLMLDLINRWIYCDEDRNPNNYMIKYNSRNAQLVIAIDFLNVDLVTEGAKIEGLPDQFGWSRLEKTRYLTPLKVENFLIYDMTFFNQRFDYFRKLDVKAL